MKTYEPRPCALRRCGQMFTPVRSFQKFCCYAHARNSGNQFTRAERAARRETKGARHPLTKYIREALADTKPGLCPWCDVPLTGRRTASCGDAECDRAYQRAYRNARTETQRAGRGLKSITCACGCGVVLQQDCLQRKYVDARHYADHRARLQRERRAASPKPIGRPRKAAKSAFMRPFGKATEPKAIRPFYH